MGLVFNPFTSTFDFAGSSADGAPNAVLYVSQSLSGPQKTQAQTNIDLLIGTNVQAFASTLTTWALTTPPSSYAVGDLLYASGANTLSKLADVATGNALISGGVTTAPAWGKITTAHTTGIAASGANGDITSLTACASMIRAGTVTVGTTGSNNLVLQTNSIASLTFSPAANLATFSSQYNLVSNGIMSFPTGGSAAVPKIIVTGTDSGFYFPNSGLDVGISTAGTQRGLFNSSGLTIAGDIISSVAGKGLQLKSGTGARTGNATLVGGTVTVTNTTVTANTVIQLSRKTAGGTIGNLTYTLSAGASFTIDSDNALDTSVVTYLLIELV